MKTIKPFILLLATLMILTTSGCNLPLQKTKTSEMVLTSAVETVNAQLTRLPTKRTETSTPSGISSTLTAAAMISPQPTTAQATATSIPCNWAKFISENIPDDTKINAGSSFEKKWLLKNIGSCSWTSGYHVIFDHGDQMDAPESIPFSSYSNNTIEPGEILEISVPLKAPDEAGVYQADFLLQSSDGIVFGLGSQADEHFWVKVSVNALTKTPTQTITPTSTQTIVLTPTSTSTPVPMPDLTIIDFSLDKASYPIGQEVKARVSIVNQGSINAGEFTVKWIPDLTHSDQAFYQNVDLLNSQEGVVLNFSLPNGYQEVKSTINTKILVDVDNMVIEIDESNNDKSIITSSTQ